LGKALESVLARCVSLGAGVKDDERITGVVVGVCGPVGMGDDVVKAVGKIEERRRRAVGGVEVHEE
jgi:ferric-chelate reductase